MSGRAGFKGGGQTGQLPRASTTMGPPHKNNKKLLPKKTFKKYFVKLIIWNKKERVGHRVYM